MSDRLSAAAERPALLSLRGRLGRVQFIAYTSLCALAVSLLLSGFAFLLLLFPQSLARNWSSAVAVGAMNLLLPVLAMTLAVRRLHDLGKPGWLAGLLLVPVANALLMLVLWAWPGQGRGNPYGEAPGPASGFLLGAAIGLPVLLVAGYLSSGPLDDEWKRQAAAPRPPVSAAHSAPKPSANSLRPY